MPSASDGKPDPEVLDDFNNLGHILGVPRLDDTVRIINARQRPGYSLAVLSDKETMTLPISIDYIFVRRCNNLCLPQRKLSRHTGGVKSISNEITVFSF